jgi:hypothetical protein
VAVACNNRHAAVASLLILVVYGMMLLLAVITPEISGWALVILLPICFVLSVMGLRFAKTAASRASGWLAFIVNACSLAFSSLIILSLAAMFVGSTNEAILIPDGYKGDIYVLYSSRDGEVLNKTRWRVTYRIPIGGDFANPRAGDSSLDEDEILLREAGWLAEPDSKSVAYHSSSDAGKSCG